jgi:polyisoprenoid-binding protein YceI
MVKTLQFSRFALLVCSMVAGGFGSPLGKTGSEPGPRVPANSEAGSERAATPSADGVARYRIDAGQSRFMVHAFAGGLLSALAHNHNIAVREFSGEAQFTYGSFEPASLHLTVKAGSLAVTDKISEKDRNDIERTMRDEVLETGKYPEIVFRSTGVSATKLAEGKYRAKISGNLSLHGETRGVEFNAEIDLSANSLRAKGDIPLKQTSFNIKPVSVAGGTIKVKDEVKLSFDIVAH